MKLRSTNWSMALLLALLFGTMAFPQSSNALSPVSADSWSICPNASTSKITDIDLLLMMDNSTSLNNSKKSKPTDPNNVRFTAVEGLFESIAAAINDSSTTVNFALVKFAQDAELVGTPWTKTITNSSAKSVAKDVRDALDSKFQRDGTNFIDAMDVAIKTFEKRSKNIDNYAEQFCPILIWFTDGQFSFLKPKDDGRKAEVFDASKLSDLVKESCDSNGFADKFRSLGIAPFIMLLKPNSTDANVSTSWAVMQHITGMTEMPVGYGYSGETKCGDISNRNQIGEVYPAENAAELGPYFRIIACKTTGCVSPTECPNKLEDYVSVSLPAARFIQKIQITNLAKSTNQEFRIRTGDGNFFDITSEFEKLSVDSSTYDFVPKENSKLEAGWVLVADAGMKKSCVLFDLIDDNVFEVELKSNGGEDIQVNQVGNNTPTLTAGDLTSISFYLNDVQTSRTDLFSSIETGSNVWGTLNVDGTGRIDSDGIRVRVIGISSRVNFDDCSSTQFAIPKSGESTSGDIPAPPRIYSTQSCEVDLRNLKADTKLSIDISQLIRQLSDTQECSTLTPSILLNGIEQSGPMISIVEPQKVSVALSFRIADDTERSNCEIEVLDGITFSETVSGVDGQKLNRQVRVLTSLTPPPCTACAIAITVLVVGIAMLLSLLILRIVSSVFTSMPDYKRYTALAFPIEIELSDSGYLRVTSEGKDISKVEPNAGDFIALSGGKDSIKVGSTKIVRILPRLFKPFSEARARIEGSDLAIYKPGVKDGGLSLPFINAVIVRVPSSTKAVNNVISASLILLVRKNNAHKNFISLLTGELVRESAREAVKMGSAADVASSKILNVGVQEETNTQSSVIQEVTKKVPPPPPSR